MRINDESCYLNTAGKIKIKFPNQGYSCFDFSCGLARVAIEKQIGFY